MTRPDSNFYEDVSRNIAAKALEHLRREFGKRNLLPLGQEATAIIFIETANAVRNGLSNLAEIHADGADIAGAILLRPDDTNNPPSPL